MPKPAHSHAAIRRYVTMWSSGLITDREFAMQIAFIHNDDFRNPPADGDVDPNTNLRYTTPSTPTKA